jgi:transketolase
MFEKSLVKNLFSKNISRAATRDGYGEALFEIGEKNKNVVVLSADLAESTRVLKFKQKFPQRFIEVGVAEQNLAGVAAGLALEGKIPFCSSFAAFSPGRNWEQIRVSICYNRAKVIIAGSHAGVVTGSDGATHQALEDMALMRVLPNMTVISTVDFWETKKAVYAALKWPGPVYLRFARINSPIITTKNTSFKIGQVLIMKKGCDATLIGCGPIIYEALLAAKELQKQKIEVEVINCHTIKPLDEKTIFNSVKKTGCLVTLEDHQVRGGLGSSLVEVLAKNYPVPVEMMGLDDVFGESGEDFELLKKHGLTSENIIRKIKTVIKRKHK